MNQNRKPNTCAAFSWKTLTAIAMPPLAVQVIFQISLQSLVLSAAWAQSSEFQAQSLRQLPMPAPAAASSPLHPPHHDVKVAEIGTTQKVEKAGAPLQAAKTIKAETTATVKASQVAKTAKITKKWKPDPNKPWRPAVRAGMAGKTVALAAPVVTSTRTTAATQPVSAQPVGAQPVSAALLGPHIEMQPVQPLVEATPAGKQIGTQPAKALPNIAPHATPQVSKAVPHPVTPHSVTPHPVTPHVVTPHAVTTRPVTTRPATARPVTAHPVTAHPVSPRAVQNATLSSPVNPSQGNSLPGSVQAGTLPGSQQVNASQTNSSQANPAPANSAQANAPQGNAAQASSQAGTVQTNTGHAPSLTPGQTASAKPAIKKVMARKKCFIRSITENSKPASVSKAAKEADRKVQDHDLAGAVNVWSTELEARPNNADSWVGRAGVKRLIGDFHGASDDLDQAVELNPNHVAALISRAAVRRRLADMRGAAKDIDKAVDLAPRNFQAYSERSSLRFALNDMQGAMADYNYAITLYPEMNKQAAKYTYGPSTNPLIANSPAGVQSNSAIGSSSQSKPTDKNESKHENKNDSKNSERNHEKSNESNEKVSERSGNRAERAQKRAHENLPHYTAAELARMNNAAVQDINTKHFADAIEAFERLLRISPDYAHARENLVIAHNNFGLELAMRKPTEALKQFRAALFLDPGQAAIRKNLFAIMQENGLDPANADDHIIAADQCLASGDPEGAYVELSEALKSKNTPQLRDKMQQALAAIDKVNARRVHEDRESRDEMSGDSGKQAMDLPPPTILGALLPAITEEPQAAATQTASSATTQTASPATTQTASPATIQTASPVTSQTASSSTSQTTLPAASQTPATMQQTSPAAVESAPSTMTTIAALPNAIIRTRPETVTLRAVQPSEAFKPANYESPSAMPTYDASFVKSTLDNAPETVLQVARQLASEDRELDAEALLHRLCDMLRKKTIRGDRSAEALLENTLETLSDLYMKHARYQNAEPTLRELLSLREKTKGQDDPVLGRTLAHYASVLKALGRNEEATKMELRANFILNQ